MLETAEIRSGSPYFLGREYEKFATEKLSLKTLVFDVVFQPFGTRIVPLVKESGEKEFGDLINGLTSLQSLERVCAGELQYYVIFLFDRKPANKDKFKDELLKKWGADYCRVDRGTSSLIELSLGESSG